jgi:PKD repeat protein
VQFTDVSSGTVLERGWDFGDQAGTSTGWRPAYVYDAGGLYTVTLGVTNTSGSDWITGTVVVSATPHAAFVYSPTEVYSSTLVQFTDVSTGQIEGRLWEFGDGEGALVQSPVHTFVEPGIVTVTLTVTGTTGCANSTSQPIRVFGAYRYYYAPIVGTTE